MGTSNAAAAVGSGNVSSNGAATLAPTAGDVQRAREQATLRLGNGHSAAQLPNTERSSTDGSKLHASTANVDGNSRQPAAANAVLGLSHDPAATQHETPPLAVSADVLSGSLHW